MGPGAPAPNVWGVTGSNDLPNERRIALDDENGRSGRQRLAKPQAAGAGHDSMKITKGREPTGQVSMALPPKFLAACRLVFGDDKPATIWGAIVSDDPRINEVRALAARDPKRWFVSALDKHGIPRLYAHGDTKDEAMKKAQLAVMQYRESEQSFRQMKPRTDWTFHPYPPDEQS